MDRITGCSIHQSVFLITAGSLRERKTLSSSGIDITSSTFICQLCNHWYVSSCPCIINFTSPPWPRMYYVEDWTQSHSQYELCSPFTGLCTVRKTRLWRHCLSKAVADLILFGGERKRENHEDSENVQNTYITIQIQHPKRNQRSHWESYILLGSLVTVATSNCCYCCYYACQAFARP